jgi:hypothetical protein
VLTVEAGFFPLDEQLALYDKHWSEGVVKEAVWLSGVVESYERAEEVMRRIGQLHMSDSTIWRRVERWGATFAQVEQAAAAQANAVPQRGESIVVVQTAARRLGAALDGAMVHIRQEGWKELKVGCLFAIAQTPVWDEETQEWRPQGQAVDTSYVAHLGEPEPFGHKLWAEAQARGWEAAAETQVVGDGAVWIWHLAEEHLNPLHKTVDWYHATQHLHDTANRLFPGQQAKTTRWYNAAETLLYQGHAEQIASMISQRGADQEELLAHATYFENNKRRMDYMTLREEGYLIGSGVVESGAKQFKSRFTGPGMRWSRSGFNHLLPVRTAILSNAFDLLWPTVYSFSKN